METLLLLSKPIRFLLALLFELGVKVRNILFDYNLLPSETFNVPVIAIGNITVGGTGKTPHTEYVLKMLSQQMHVAVLSRGYKRKSKGFQLGDEHATATLLGDEPFQMFRKFPQVTVAVDANRRRGIRNLLRIHTEDPIGAIVLDDAFQHRFVKPTVNILLVDSHRLITEDALMPYGRLREPASNKKRANIVIVTKCDRSLQPIDYRLIQKKLSLFPYQTLYYTTYGYEALYPVFPQYVTIAAITPDELASKNLLIVSGIANPDFMIEFLSSHAKTLETISFLDHYAFKKKDYDTIQKAFEELNHDKYVVVTEKDAARLYSDPLLPEELKPYIYALPIAVEFINNQDQVFNHQIISYVSKN
ncbi:tetraacyldisaccharide 4'-kinase [Microbacter margulisiae]|uniref:Tetraacyldisaccharide 4'-kinase n=1 Tax=Microbacter margulisiae TaxID=1350067 RepID=A0A7W5DR16_9PORP|nr:tetraacyldisaccharide 4'-kinase [Microbacter margulisiae]MBB3187510.1 tetraacyldisaccharide 4'-kinase [Microbacter margulisiae]